MSVLLFKKILSKRIVRKVIIIGFFISLTGLAFFFLSFLFVDFPEIFKFILIIFIIFSGGVLILVIQGIYGIHSLNKRPPLIDGGNNLNYSLFINPEKINREGGFKIRIKRYIPCTYCDYTGFISGRLCHECRGSRKMVETKSIYVNVPPNIENGTILRLKGGGHILHPDDEPGNLLVEIRLEKKIKMSFIAIGILFLIISFLTFQIIVLIPIITAEFYQIFSICKNILGLISGGLSIGIVFYIAINTIKRFRKAAISGISSETIKTMKKSTFSIFILLGFGIFNLLIVIISIFPGFALFIFPMAYQQNFVNGSIGPIIFITILVSVFLIYVYRFILKNMALPKVEELIRFRDLLKGREKVSISELQLYYKNDEDFYEKVLQWVEKFNFTIDGDTIILNEESLEEFISTLDNEYKKWKYQEKKREKKKL